MGPSVFPVLPSTERFPRITSPNSVMNRVLTWSGQSSVKSSSNWSKITTSGCSRFWRQISIEPRTSHSDAVAPDVTLMPGVRTRSICSSL